VSKAAKKVAASAGRKDCRVTHIDVHVVDARWRNFVFAHVHTDDGISGIGEGSCEFQPQMVAAGIEMLAHRVVVGQSAFQIENVWTSETPVHRVSVMCQSSTPKASRMKVSFMQRLRSGLLGTVRPGFAAS
jgi:L-alanine-DL-glutamate epimerase-like enolase superfamily enzyme